MANIVKASSSLFRKKWSCKYPSCQNSYYINSPNKKFHRFPKDPDTLSLWKSTCKLNNCLKPENQFICEDHFSDSDYSSCDKIRLKYNCNPKPFPRTSLSSLVPNESISTKPTSITPSSDAISSEINAICHSDSVDLNVLSENVETAGVLKENLDPRNVKIHRNIRSKLSKLKSQLKNAKADVSFVRKLYEEGRFEFIESTLNAVTKEFINSQLRNSSRAPSGKRWTMEDKAFALSVYKRSPRLYRYLQAHFELPSIRLLKSLLSNISFHTGINPNVMDYLKRQVRNMDDVDKYCTLIFDEVQLSSGLHYEANEQRISGFEDLGALGTNNKMANHALVFMVRGIQKNYKQVVAYYFVQNTIAATSLKQLIVEIISNLQAIGLKVVATVCDQGSTNVAACTSLCKNNDYVFEVNGEKICTIYDVPHLLKNTRNALLRYDIEYESGKRAKFVHIQTAFNLDQQRRTYKQLPKLKQEYFNFDNSYVKMKVKVAAAQLSHTVAASIETFHVTNDLPAESLATAEFVHLMDQLFDSLNGWVRYPRNGKEFRCALSKDSPHLAFWSNILSKINKWKMIDRNGKDCTKSVRFLKGWQTTIRSVIFLWKHLQEKGVAFLSLRSLNQDPLENLFCQVRQHGAFNINPTCHQFVAALKTLVVNNFSVPLSRGRNCQDDYCESLGNLHDLLLQNSPEDLRSNDKMDLNPDFTDIEQNLEQNNQATAYVAGYFLKNINIPDCTSCRENLYSAEGNENHLFTSFKEYNNDTHLQYASDGLIKMVDAVHERMYQFLDKYGHLSPIETTFKTSNVDFFNSYQFCEVHDVKSMLLDKCIRLNVYKYLKDKNNKDVSIRKFKKKKNQ